jgi:hypothetical protein
VLRPSGDLRLVPLPSAPSFQDGLTAGSYTSDEDEYLYKAYLTGYEDGDLPEENSTSSRQDYQRDPGSGASWSQSTTSSTQRPDIRHYNNPNSGHNSVLFQAVQLGQPSVPSTEVKVGSIYYRHPYDVNARFFRCDYPDCRNLSFNRAADFHRHFVQLHAPEKPEYWCTIPGCTREEPFSRKDKMLDHAKTRHA